MVNVRLAHRRGATCLAPHAGLHRSAQLIICGRASMLRPQPRRMPPDPEEQPAEMQGTRALALRAAGTRSPCGWRTCCRTRG